MNKQFLVVFVGIVVSGVGACSRSPEPPTPADSDPLALVAEELTMHIEVLGFEGCPNTPKFRQRVLEAAETFAPTRTITVIYVDQEALPDDDVRRGYPTPTALVDGHDLFGLPVPTSPAMGCRIYSGGLPTIEQITAKLSAFND